MRGKKIGISGYRYVRSESEEILGELSQSAFASLVTLAQTLHSW